MVTRSTTDIRKYFIDRKESRPESDLSLPSIFVWNAGLLILRSDNRMVRWEERKFCKSRMNSMYHPHHQVILRITSPTLAVNESGSNWFSTCKLQHRQPSSNSGLQNRSRFTFPTVTMCVACEDPDAVTILGAADACEGVESWLRTTPASPIRNKESTAEAILFHMHSKGCWQDVMKCKYAPKGSLRCTTDVPNLQEMRMGGSVGSLPSCYAILLYQLCTADHDRANLHAR